MYIHMYINKSSNLDLRLVTLRSYFLAINKRSIVRFCQNIAKLTAKLLKKYIKMTAMTKYPPVYPAFFL